MSHAHANNDQRLKHAAELFRLRGGAAMQRALRMLEGTLDVYEQDLQRARADNAPEKFRWRVKPAEAMRAMREQQRLQAALEALLASCHDEAMATQAAAEPAPTREAKAAAASHHGRRPAGTPPAAPQPPAQAGPPEPDARRPAA